MVMLQGFDYSHHQDTTDAALMKSLGADFVFIKGTEHETFLDSRFPENWRKARAADLIRGGYHFARPDADPRDDVDGFVDYVRAQGELLPTDLFVLDLEVSELGQDATSAWAEGWALEFRRRMPGYVPGVYMGSGYLTNRTGQGLRGPFGWLWYPRPTRTDEAWPTSFAPPPPRNRDGISVPWSESAWGGLPDIWQFNWDWDIAGEAHDANVFNGDLSRLTSLNNGGEMALTRSDAITLWTAAEWREYADENENAVRDYRPPIDILYATHRAAVLGARDSAIARALAEKHATEGRALTAAEIEAIGAEVEERFAGGVDVRITVGVDEEPVA